MGKLRGHTSDTSMSNILLMSVLKPWLGSNLGNIAFKVLFQIECMFNNVPWLVVQHTQGSSLWKSTNCAITRLASHTLAVHDLHISAGGLFARICLRLVPEIDVCSASLHLPCCTRQDVSLQCYTRCHWPIWNPTLVVFLLFWLKFDITEFVILLEFIHCRTRVVTLLNRSTRM